MATNERDYRAWCEYHADRFAFAEADSKLLTNWYDVLKWYTPAQLQEATDALLRSDYPSFARDHLKALLPLLRELEARSLQGRAKDGRDPDRGTCTHCGGSGWVCDLPHPKSVVDGQWVYPWFTCAVFCLCGLGRWQQQHWLPREGRPRPLDLATYDGLNTGWEAQRAEWQARQRAERHALEDVQAFSAEAQMRRSRLDETLARLAQQFCLPQEES